MDKNKLVVFKENCPVLADEVETILDNILETQDTANKLVENTRSELLEAMIENNIYSCKVGKYTISQVLGKDKVIFDTDKFMLEASEDIVMAFTSISKGEPTFDIERFKLEHPEMYNAYLEPNDVVEVDVKKLEKTMPNVFERFVTRIKSDKKPTIMIKVAKEK